MEMLNMDSNLSKLIRILFSIHSTWHVAFREVIRTSFLIKHLTVAVGMTVITMVQVNSNKGLSIWDITVSSHSSVWHTKQLSIQGVAFSAACRQKWSCDILRGFMQPQLRWLLCLLSQFYTFSSPFRERRTFVLYRGFPDYANDLMLNYTSRTSTVWPVWSSSLPNVGGVYWLKP